jgi:hypothetical protein
MYAFGIGSGRFTRASGKVGVNENDGTRRSRGTDGSNPVPSAGESALTSAPPCNWLAIAGRSPPVRAVGTGLAIALLQFGSPNIPEIRVPAALIMDP